MNVSIDVRSSFTFELVCLIAIDYVYIFVLLYHKRSVSGTEIRIEMALNCRESLKCCVSRN